MYQRLPYHGHCCSTRDDFGLNTQPYSAFLSLSEPFSTVLSLSQPLSTLLRLSQPSSVVFSLSQPYSAFLSLNYSAVVSFLTLIQSYLAFLKLSSPFSLSHPSQSFSAYRQPFSAEFNLSQPSQPPYSAFFNLPQPFADLLSPAFSHPFSLTQPI